MYFFCIFVLRAHSLIDIWARQKTDHPGENSSCCSFLIDVYLQKHHHRGYNGPIGQDNIGKLGNVGS